MPTEYAKAKINLTLHVGRVINDRADPFFGYHPLDSLVVFADVADKLSCEDTKKTSLVITGPHRAGLENDEDNLILKAYRAVARQTRLPELSFHLEKNLPVAAGIGGGSANAAATLRLLKNYTDLPEAVWQDIALKIGADVPVCLLSQTAHMTGIGESLHRVGGLGRINAVLVNPGVPVITRDIFTSFDGTHVRETPRPQKPDGDLLSRALDGRNDLEPVAARQQPVIDDVLQALSMEQGCQIARLSGSGATCFGLFDTREQALRASDNLRAKAPDWWVQPAQLGDPQ